MDSANTGSTGLKVLMFPWLAYGHITPFLELAKTLSDRGFGVYLLSTSINLKFIEKKIPEKYAKSIFLSEFHLPNLPELPPENHTTNGLPPHLMSTLSDAVRAAKPDFLATLRALKPNLLIYDLLVTWAASMAVENRIPAVGYLTSSAAMCSYFSHVMRNPGVEYPFPALRLNGFEKAMVHGLAQRSAQEREERRAEEEERPAVGNGATMLINSSRQLESKYIDYFSEMISWRVLAIGPLIQASSREDEYLELMEWLGRKNQGSCVFVSFGSEYFLTREEIEEVAIGLELSEVNFIWVVRFPLGEKVELANELPQGFLGRVEGRGWVVEGWAPQAKILSHQSIGGFVSHCGWNSTVESIEYGVPIIAMPMQLDQPMNAKLAVEVGVAVEVARDDTGKLQREEIAKVIKDVVFGEIGIDVRGKVRDLRDKLRSERDQVIDEVAEELKQLCIQGIA